MTTAHAHCPAAADRCGHSGIFLVCSIQVHSLGRQLIEGREVAGWGGGGHMTPLHMIPDLARTGARASRPRCPYKLTFTDELEGNLSHPVF
jgi:hypothetical protein